MKQDFIFGPFLLVVIPIIIFEAIIRLYIFKKEYDFKETFTSFSIAIGQIIIRPINRGVILITFSYFAKYSIFQLDNSVWVWVAGFFAFEFLYYWLHRFGHTVKWFWANHSVHHSSNSFNFATAIRLGWANIISLEWLIFLPMILLGFSPQMVAILSAINLGYQFFIHTELSPKWGVLEYILNTPSHHKVHHASNTGYLDKNFGGTLIIFDYLFGTFAKEDKNIEIKFGLANQEKTYNPFKIIFLKYYEIFKNAFLAKNLKQFASAFLAKP